MNWRPPAKVLRLRNKRSELPETVSVSLDPGIPEHHRYLHIPAAT